MGPRSMPLSRVLIQARKDQDVDHINRNPFDNRKCNLRACSRSVNMQNGGCRRGVNATSSYKGVGWDKHRRKWHAQIGKDYVNYNLGRFNTECDAALAYNEAAARMYGPCAYLNEVN